MDKVLKDIIFNLTETEKATAYRQGVPSLIVSLSQHKTLQEILDDPLAGIILDVTPMFEYLLGYMPGQLIGQLYETLVPEDVRPHHKMHFARFTLNQEPRLMGTKEMNLRAVRHDGTELSVEILLIPQMLKVGSLPVVVVTMFQSRLGGKS